MDIGFLRTLCYITGMLLTCCGHTGIFVSFLHLVCLSVCLYVPVFITGSVFPWKKCGFHSAIALLERMSDVVRFQYSPKDGEYRLYGIGTSDMFMPSWVVRAQSCKYSIYRIYHFSQIYLPN